MLSEKALDHAHDASDKSVGGLFTQLAGLSSELVRDEFALAKHEIRERLKSVVAGVILAVIGALMGQAALLACCAAAAFFLASYLGAWQAVLVVGIVLGLVAVIIVSVAVNRLAEVDLKPEQTLETLEENKKWLKELT